MEIIQMLQKNIETIQSDIKDVNRKLDKVTQKIIDYENKKFICAIDFDTRYVQKSDFRNYFRGEIESYYEQRTQKLQKKTEITNNILQILYTLLPLIIMALTFFGFKIFTTN